MTLPFDDSAACSGFRVHKRIWQGGVGEICVATRVGADGGASRVLLKRLADDYVGTKVAVDAFRADASIAHALRHENLAAAVEFLEHPQDPLIVLEYLDGLTLAQVAEFYAQRGEHIAPPVVMYVVAEVAHGVAFAHRARGKEGKLLGLIHGDVNPGQILLGRFGGVKLFGFDRAGIAAARMLGTSTGVDRTYTPPPLATAASQRWVDIFALGAILSRLLGDVAAQPAGIQAVIERATGRMAPFRDALEFYSALRGYLCDAQAWVSKADVARVVDTIVSAREAALPPEVTRLPDKRIHLRHEVRAKTFGPVSVENFRKLLQSRSVGSHEQISIDGGPWTELGRTCFAPETNEDMSRTLVEGGLRPATLPRLLHELSSGRLTGRLQLTGLRARKEIYLDKGLISYVGSTLRSELLADIMRHNEMISRRDLDRALSHAERHGGRLGDALVELEILDVEDVTRAVRLQFDRRCVETFSWRQGVYRFVPGLRPPSDPEGRRVRVLPVLVRGVRENYTLEEFEALYRDVGASRVTPTMKDPDGPSIGPLLTPSEHDIVSLLMMRPTLSWLVGRCRTAAERHVALRVLFLYQQTDRVTLLS